MIATDEQIERLEKFCDEIEVYHCIYEERDGIFIDGYLTFDELLKISDIVKQGTTE